MSKYQFFDKYIKVVFYKEEGLQSTSTAVNTALSLIGKVASIFNDDTPVLVLDCPAYGMKPSINLSMQMLPAGYAQTVKITVDNFYPDFDISDYVYMEITAGYRSLSLQNTGAGNQVFTAAITSTMIESPNPNGRTSFNGLIGSWFINNLMYSPVKIVINTNPSILDFTTSICKELGLTLISDEFPEQIGKQKLMLKTGTAASLTVAQPTGQSAFDWMVKVIQDWATSQNKIPVTQADGTITYEQITVEFFRNGQNKVMITCGGYIPEGAETNAIQLDRVMSIGFQGAGLSIKAPWMPQIQPGQLIKIESSYIRGRPSLNAIKSFIIDENGYYRVIDISINFSTVGDANEMTIQCIAQKNYGTASAFKDAVFTKVEDATKSQETSPNTIYSTVRTIEIGRIASITSVPKVETVKSAWDDFAGRNAAFQEIASRARVITMPHGYELRHIATHTSPPDVVYSEDAQHEYKVQSQILPSWWNDVKPVFEPMISTEPVKDTADECNPDTWKVVAKRADTIVFNNLPEFPLPGASMFHMILAVTYYRIVTSQNKTDAQKETLNRYHITSWQDPNIIGAGTTLYLPQLTQIRDFRLFEGVYRGVCRGMGVSTGVNAQLAMTSAYARIWQLCWGVLNPDENFEAWRKYFLEAMA